MSVAPYYTHTSEADEPGTAMDEIDAFFGENLIGADVLTFYFEDSSDTAGNVVVGGGAFLVVSMSFVNQARLELADDFISTMRDGAGRRAALDNIASLEIAGDTSEEEFAAAADLGDGGWGIATQTNAVPFSLLYFRRGNVIVNIISWSDALIDPMAIARAVDGEILRTVAP